MIQKSWLCKRNENIWGMDGKGPYFSRFVCASFLKWLENPDSKLTLGVMYVMIYYGGVVSVYHVGVGWLVAG